MSHTPTTRLPLPRRAGRTAIRLAIGLAALTVASYACLMLLVAGYLAEPRRLFDATNTPALYGLAYEDVRLAARGDDADIAAWFIPSPSSDRAIVLTHGKDGSRTQEFRGAFPALALTLHQRGFNVLMIDLRGHGQSSDARHSFGLAERRDVLGAVDYLHGRGFAKSRIGLLGVSMGAAASLGAMADDAELGAVVADSGYADFVPLVRAVWTRITRLPAAFIEPALRLRAADPRNPAIDGARPAEDARRIGSRPLFIIHGTADVLVPVEEAERLRAANPRAEVWIVPGAQHGGSFRAQPTAYAERVSGFFDRSLR